MPTAERLAVHLPGMTRVSFTEHLDLNNILDDPDTGKSTLTEWFVENQRHIAARDYTYCEFPTKWT